MYLCSIMKKEKEILSAEDFFRLNQKDKYGRLRPAHEIGIEFTKVHVEAALEAASKKAEVKELKTKHTEFGSEFFYVKKLDRKSILNAYPKRNIK